MGVERGVVGDFGLRSGIMKVGEGELQLFVSLFYVKLLVISGIYR